MHINSETLNDNNEQVRMQIYLMIVQHECITSVLRRYINKAYIKYATSILKH